VGQLLRLSGPLARAADRHRTAIGVVVRLLTFLIIMKAAVDVVHRLSAQAEVVPGASLALTMIACLGVHVAALYVGLWSSRWLGFERPRQIAVAIAGSQKTLPVALYLFDVYYQAYPLAVVPMVVYHVGQLVVDTFVAEAFAGRRPEEMPAAEAAV
jgi:sodium/bile acid cotransporter 7